MSNEIKAAFGDFATLPSNKESYKNVQLENESVASQIPRFLQKSDLQPALIQIFNKYVSMTEINNALKSCGDFDDIVEEFTLHEFKRIVIT